MLSLEVSAVKSSMHTRGWLVFRLQHGHISPPLSVDYLKCLLATRPDAMRASLSPTPQFPGKLLLSINESSCNNSSIVVSSQPSSGSFLCRHTNHHVSISIAICADLQKCNFLIHLKLFKLLICWGIISVALQHCVKIQPFNCNTYLIGVLLSAQDYFTSTLVNCIMVEGLNPGKTAA